MVVLLVKEKVFYSWKKLQQMLFVIVFIDEINTGTAHKTWNDS